MKDVEGCLLYAFAFKSPKVFHIICFVNVSNKIFLRMELGRFFVLESRSSVCSGHTTKPGLESAMVATKDSKGMPLL